MSRRQSHFFVDNSNLIGGAQRAAASFDPEVPYFCIRIYWQNFFELIEKHYLPVTRVFAGSLPPGNEQLWQYARRFGYSTDLLHRVNKDDGKLSEQGVDELLHLKIANVLLDYQPPQRLVLITGDGNQSEFGTSFLRQVERAVRLEWIVEIWSWEAQLSNRFRRAQQKNSDQVSIRLLDEFYHQITFVKGGCFDIRGQEVQVPERIVGKL